MADITKFQAKDNTNEYNAFVALTDDKGTGTNLPTGET